MPERQFELELEASRKDASAGIQFLYTYLGLHTVLGRNGAALDCVNQNPLFWRTVDGALHGEVFITLGRIFDQKSAHNVDRLIKLARENQQILSLEALAARKRRGAANADEWLPAFLAAAHVPTVDDFRDMKRFVKQLRATYQANYKDIRDRVLAHAELVEDNDIQALYERTNIAELADLFGKLQLVFEVLWQLYQNGRRPDWTFTTLLPDEILNRGDVKEEARELQKRVVFQTAAVLGPLVR